MHSYTKHVLNSLKKHINICMAIFLKVKIHSKKSSSRNRNRVHKLKKSVIVDEQLMM